MNQEKCRTLLNNFRERGQISVAAFFMENDQEYRKDLLLINEKVFPEARLLGLERVTTSPYLPNEVFGIFVREARVP